MLRRVVANIHRQDWTAVVVELAVVVIGVFIGVQAANWNALRETDQKAAIFTEYTTNVFDWFTGEGRTSPLRQAFRKRVPYRTQAALEEACGDRVVPTGNYAGIATRLDYPCHIDVAPTEIAEVAKSLRGASETLQLVNLRIADIGTNIGNLTSYDADALREKLRAIVREKP